MKGLMVCCYFPPVAEIGSETHPTRVRMVYAPSLANVYRLFGRLNGALTREHGVETLVAANGPAPHPVVLEAVSRAHLQLLRIVKPMISTKLFEGLAMSLPFLATILDARAAYAQGCAHDYRTAKFLQQFGRQSLALKMMQLMSTVASRPEPGAAAWSAESGPQPETTP